MRSAGLYLGVEIVSDPVAKTPSAELAARLVDASRRAGVLVGLAGSQAHVLKVRPPLPFGAMEAAIFLERLETALGSLDS